MTGVIGADIQHSRTALAVVLEAGAMGAALVGDGRRKLAPNACEGDRWGSSAAKHVLAALPNGARVDGHESLEPWRCDPWSIPFLAGMRARLFGYLGQTSPIHRHGYHVCLTSALSDVVDAAPDGITVRDRCVAAGLTDVTLVHPTDALVCRWLADSAAPPGVTGTIVAVACGQTWSSVTSYRVDRYDRRVVIDIAPGSQPSTAQVGGRDCVDRLARTVLDHCREGVTRSVLLPLLDGAIEFLGMLAVQRGQPELPWEGPLTDRLFSPVRFSATQIAQWPETTRLTGRLATLVREQTGTTPPRTILIGGVGSIGPFVTSALGDIGRVWHCPEPEFALAVGAGWWPQLRRCFVGTPKLARATAVTPALGAIQTPELTQAVTVDDAEIPPWLRE